MAANRVFAPQFPLSIVEHVLKGTSVGVLSRDWTSGATFFIGGVILIVVKEWPE
jgi:hypothetical protein